MVRVKYLLFVSIVCWLKFAEGGSFYYRPIQTPQPREMGQQHPNSCTSECQPKWLVARANCCVAHLSTQNSRLVGDVAALKVRQRELEALVEYLQRQLVVTKDERAECYRQKLEGCGKDSDFDETDYWGDTRDEKESFEDFGDSEENESGKETNNSSVDDASDPWMKFTSLQRSTTLTPPLRSLNVYTTPKVRIVVDSTNLFEDSKEDLFDSKDVSEVMIYRNKNDDKVTTEKSNWTTTISLPFEESKEARSVSNLTE